MEEKQVKHWLKENWFRSIIALGVVIISVSAFYYFVVLSHQKEVRIREKARIDLIEKNEKEAQIAAKEADAKKVAEILRANDTKSDTYVVTYDKEGNPLDWATFDIAAVILNDSLNTYKSTLPEIEKRQKGTKTAIDSGPRTLSEITNPEYRSQLQTLLNYQEVYYESGEKVLVLLRGLIQNLQGVLKAIDKRDSQLYFYYSKEADKFEMQKKSILEDYMNKSNVMTNYAKNISL